MPRKPATRRAQPKAPTTSPHVYTSATPTRADTLQHHINLTIAQRILKTIDAAQWWHNTPRLADNMAAGAEWWHTALVARDQETINAQRLVIAENNADVAALANGLDLDVKHYENASARVLQFDAVAMAKRIEAASAKHKNTTRGRAKNANRHLKFECPKCGQAARAARPDRVMMCLGLFDLPHDPTLMEFDASSQPDYRHQDAAAGTACAPEATPTDTYSENISGDHSRSQAKLNATKAKIAARLAQPKPDALAELVNQDDPKAEFGF